MYQVAIRTFRNRQLLAVMLPLLACSAPTPGEVPAMTGTTVFEGARLIIGDESPPIEDATFVVTDTLFTAIGSSADVPSGATRVDLTGRTVIPALVDTHTHLSRTRESLVEDLRHKAYYGVGVAMSLGQDSGDVPFAIREEILQDAARYRTAGRGITTPEPGRSEIPYWVTEE